MDLNDYFYFVHVIEKRGFAPAGRALGVPKSRIYRWGVLLLCLSLQALWLLAMYGSAQTYWQVP